MSKKSIYTPATIKKDFNLGIYRKLKNLFYICNIDHLIISTNSNLSTSLYHTETQKSTAYSVRQFGAITIFSTSPVQLTYAPTAGIFG